MRSWFLRPKLLELFIESEDTFTRPNSASLGGNWEATDGNWGINGNRAEQLTGATNVVRYTVAPSSIDMFVRATRETPTTGAASVCLRMNLGKTEFYMATYNTATTQWLIHRFNAAVFTVIASLVEISIPTFCYFRLEAQGSELRLLRSAENDPAEEILRVTDGTFAHPYCGIRGNSTGGTVNYLDDFGIGVIAE